jgi:signal transduction histidine kinase
VEAFQDISSLKAMEREKDNLISMFAHDMKSSLTIIGGFVLRLLKKANGLDEKKANKYLTIIQNETAKLDFLVRDFLDFARLQTGKLKLEFQATSLDKELIELFEAYQAKAMQSGIHLELHNETILPVIEADPNRLRRAFTNILDNAFKFSKKGGIIQILTEVTQEEIRIGIKDKGPGIAEVDLPHVFEAFYRGREASGKEGTGLGLASAKSIVEAHGGTVKVDSVPGRGALFTVTLPKSKEWRKENLSS